MQYLTTAVNNVTHVYYPTVKAATISAANTISANFSYAATKIETTAFANPLTTLFVANAAVTVLAVKISDLAVKILPNRLSERKDINLAARLISVVSAVGATNYALLGAFGLTLTSLPVALAVGGGVLLGSFIIATFDQVKNVREARKAEKAIKLEQRIGIVVSHLQDPTVPVQEKQRILRAAGSHAIRAMGREMAEITEEKTAAALVEEKTVELEEVAQRIANARIAEVGPNTQIAELNEELAQAKEALKDALVLERRAIQTEKDEAKAHEDAIKQRIAAQNLLNDLADDADRTDANRSLADAVELVGRTEATVQEARQGVVDAKAAVTTRREELAAIKTNLADAKDKAAYRAKTIKDLEARHENVAKEIADAKKIAKIA